MNQPKALTSLLLTVIIWGIGPVFIRTLSVDLGPADHLVIRYILVSIFYLMGLAFMGGWRIERADWPRLLIVSFVGMVGYNLGSAFGFQEVTAGVGSLIIGTQPLIIAVFAAIFARERLTLASVLGLIIGLSGIVALFWNDLSGNTGSTSLLGAAYVFLAGVAWAIYVVLTKPLIIKYGAYPITVYSISLATVVLVALLASTNTMATLQSMTTRNWFDMFYMVALSTLLATITWNYGAARVSATTAGAMIYFVPVIGVFAGALLLHEEITTHTLVGGGLILAGVAIAQGQSWFTPGTDRGQPRTGMVALAAILFAVTMWGLNPVAMRFLILDTTPQTAMILRLFPVGVLALAIVALKGTRPIAARDWIRIFIAALCGNVGYQILAAFGMQEVPASWTGMLFGLEPVFIALFAVLFAKDRLTIWLVGGIALALAGTAVLMLGSMSDTAGEVGLFGLFLVALSTMGWGIYTVVIRPVAIKYGTFEITCLALGISALPMIIFYTPEFPHILMNLGPAQWIAVGFVTIFGTFLATFAWNYALSHMQSALAGVFLYVQPVVAAIGGITLLHEKLSWPLVAGGTLIISGVAISQFGPLLRIGPPQRKGYQQVKRPLDSRA